MKVTAPDLTIVIPAYSEAKRIGGSLDKLGKFLDTDLVLKKLNIEVIVVAAESEDETFRIASGKSKQFDDFKVIVPGSRVGKGRDVKVGMLAAKGKASIFMDADLATPLKYIPIFFEIIQSGEDIVIATRNLKKHHPELTRRLLSVCGNILYRLLCGSYIEDSQCGFKMFTKEAAQLCFSKTTIKGWGFDMEVLAIANLNGLRLKSYRTNDWSSVPGGTFTDNIVKTSIKSIIELVYISFGRLNGRYK